jgi:hypothetical protein
MCFLRERERNANRLSGMSFYFSFIFAQMDIHMSSSHLSISFVLWRVSSSWNRMFWSWSSIYLPAERYSRRGSHLEWKSISTVGDQVAQLTRIAHYTRNSLLQESTNKIARRRTVGAKRLLEWFDNRALKRCRCEASEQEPNDRQSSRERNRPTFFDD